MEGVPIMCCGKHRIALIIGVAVLILVVGVSYAYASSSSEAEDYLADDYEDKHIERMSDFHQGRGMLNCPYLSEERDDNNTWEENRGNNAHCHR